MHEFNAKAIQSNQIHRSSNVIFVLIASVTLYRYYLRIKLNFMWVKWIFIHDKSHHGDFSKQMNTQYACIVCVCIMNEDKMRFERKICMWNGLETNNRHMCTISNSCHMLMNNAPRTLMFHHIWTRSSSIENWTASCPRTCSIQFVLLLLRALKCALHIIFLWII